MPKVRNLSGKGIPLLRWRVLPDGRTVSPVGEICDGLPDDIGYSDQAKRLCTAGVLKIEGINWHSRPTEPPKVEEPPSVPNPDPDDLTDLVHIGKGRAKKLKDLGIASFKDVVEMGAGDLDSVLDITREMAEEVVEDAAGRVE